MSNTADRFITAVFGLAMLGLFIFNAGNTATILNSLGSFTNSVVGSVRPAAG